MRRVDRPGALVRRRGEERRLASHLPVAITSARRGRIFSAALCLLACFAARGALECLAPMGIKFILMVNKQGQTRLAQ
jgi:hypothetical protein